MKLADLHSNDDANASCLGCGVLMFVSPVVREHTREIECSTCGKRSNIEKAMARIEHIRRDEQPNPNAIEADVGVGVPG